MDDTVFLSGMAIDTTQSEVATNITFWYIAKNLPGCIYLHQSIQKVEPVNLNLPWSTSISPVFP